MNNGTVFIIPGNLASSLGEVSAPNSPVRPIWINPIALATGKFADLALPPKLPSQIIATGLLPCYFVHLDTALRSAGYTVNGFAYDWRQDVDTIAPMLRDMLATATPPVHVLSHSLGAHLARRAVQKLAEQRGIDFALSQIASLVLMGPANFGCFSAVLGLAGATNQLPLIDVLPSPPAYVQKTLATFPSLYQVLPFDPSRTPSLADADHNCRSPGWWNGLIDTNLLTQMIPPGGTPWAATIDTSFLRDKTAIVVGDAPQTTGGVLMRLPSNVPTVSVDPQYNMTGDGYVPRACSMLPEGPATYLASGIDHLRLPLAQSVIAAVLDIFAGKAPTTVSRIV